MQPAPLDPIADGRFRLMDVLGEGGMATVYRAFDLRLQRPRAIKILAPHFATRPSLRRRFLAEAQTMANLEESHVVRVFDMGEDGDRVYIVMELIEGGSLLDRVEGAGPLPPRMACAVMAQVCDALHAAHGKGVIHRDIKPHNILLTRSGDVRVTDFGIAQVHTEDNPSMTRTGAVMGTWGYMAPEQKSNAKTVDARADVYAAGATLWALVRNETPPELFMADAEPGMLEGLPSQLAELVRTATRYRKEERFPTARDMAEALRSAVFRLPADPLDTPPLVHERVVNRAAETAAIVDTEHTREGGATLAPNVGEGKETVAPFTDGGAATVLRTDDSAGVASALPTSSPSVHATGDSAEHDVFAPPTPRTTPTAWIAGGAAIVVVAAALAWSLRPADRTAAEIAPVASAPPAAASASPAPENLPGSMPARAPATTEAAAEKSVAKKAPPPRTSSVPGARPAGETATQSANVAQPVSDPSPAEPAPTAQPAAPLVVIPPTPVPIGAKLFFQARAPRAEKVLIFYRANVGGAAFQNRPMVRNGDVWTANVAVESAMLPGVQYFVKASAGSEAWSEGSPLRPLLANVTQ